VILKDLAELVQGQIIGDPSLKIECVSSLEEAREGSLVFVLEVKNLPAALKSKASALVVPEKAEVVGKSAIAVKSPRLAMSKILKLFAPPPEIGPGVHKSAVIHSTVKLGKGISIGPLVYIGPNCEVGDNSIIYPQVTIYQNTRIGHRTIIHSGTRIGVDGFGFAPDGGKFEKVPQIGGVVIGDDVEIFGNVTVARGTLGNTVIQSGSKIDCLSHVAHNCEIGENCAIVSLVGFAGSVKMGSHVQVGGQAGFSGHNVVGDNAVIMARAGVTKDVPANSIVSGFPAVDHQEDLKFQASLRRTAKCE